jgi:hypothetical protein
VTARITVSEDRNRRLIRVEGRLSDEEVDELEQAIGDDPAHACLELSELRSADAVALSLLRRLKHSGTELRGLPPHLAWRIEDDSK